jgi:3-oxoadipate CoA-transferase, alpha subunit
LARKPEGRATVIDKVCPSVTRAVADVEDGATILVSGFGGTGRPNALLGALAKRKLSGLTIVSNNAGIGSDGLAQLLDSGSVECIVASFPRSPDGKIFERLYEEKKVKLELVPQGTLSERIRAAGAGLGGFYTPTGVGTIFAENREVREFDGRDYVFETPIHAEWAFLRAARADRWGNVVYNKSQRNYGPTMAMAAKTTVVEVAEIVDVGSLDAEAVVTPGVFVQAVVGVPA